MTLVMLRLSVGEVMEVNDELYLTDEQYLRILKKIETTVGQGGFKVSCADYTVVARSLPTVIVVFVIVLIQRRIWRCFPTSFLRGGR